MAKLIHLRCENFKRIVCIDLDFEGRGSHVNIVGPNGSGKSSLLDSLAYLFGGSKFRPEMPIRIGAETCTIVARLDSGLTIKRRTTETTDKLTIESDDGAVFKSPQQVADQMFSEIAFSPNEFTRMSSKQQAALLRQITGVDTSLLDSRRKTLYAERTKVNAVYESLAAQVEAIVIPVPPTEIGEEIDVAAVAKKRAEVVEHNSKVDDLLESAEDADKAIAKQTSDINRIKESLAKMEARLTELRTQKLTLEAELATISRMRTDELDATIENAKSVNAVVRGNIQAMNEHKRAIEQKEVAEKNVRKKKDEADELTEQIKKIDADKAAMLAAAQFPVSGMSVEGDEVLIDGVPFSQIASSEQTRVGLAMAMSQRSMQGDKAVKVCLIRDGDRIDDDKRKLIQEWAEKNGILILEERINRPGVVGIELIDGHLKGVVLPPDESTEAAVSGEAELAKKPRRKKPAEAPAVPAGGLLDASEDPPE